MDGRAVLIEASRFVSPGLSWVSIMRMFDIAWHDVRSLVQAMERQASRALCKWDVGETGSDPSLRLRMLREAIVHSSSRSSPSLHLTDL